MKSTFTYRQLIALVTTIVVLAFSNFQNLQAQAPQVNFRLSPESSTLAVGSSVTVEVQIEAGNNEVDAVAVHLNFDPAVLTVESMQPSGALRHVLQNEFSNSGANAGQINFAAGVITDTPPSGTFVLLEIEFRALTTTDSAGTTLSYANAGVRKTNAFVGIEPALGTTTPATIVVPDEFDLTVNVNGNGTVTKNPDQATYLDGTNVQLNATPAAGWAFAGWSGACSGASACQVTMDSDKSVTATFTEIPPDQYALTLNVVGNGTITKDPDQTTYTEGTNVQLTATPAAGWTFTGWSGACSGTGACQVTMDSNKTVTATFTENEYTLAITIIGDGTVSKSPNQATYNFGDVVNLTATPLAGWSFAGWGGACSGSGACAVTMNGNRAVTANFTQNEYTVTVNVVGNGTVTKNPDQATYPSGTIVELTATPAPGWNFVGWSGDCSGVLACGGEITRDVTVTATFTENPPDEYALTINVVGNGTITKDPDQTTYTEGTNVDLTATAAEGWTFTGWDGECSGTGVCEVTMDDDKLVTATFTEDPPVCYTLTLTHIGDGTDPIATPSNSAGCEPGSYVAGAVITLSGASPAQDWEIDGWTGTEQDDATSDTNTLVMPAEDHTVSVIYDDATIPTSVLNQYLPSIFN